MLDADELLDKTQITDIVQTYKLPVQGTDRDVDVDVRKIVYR